MVFILVDMRSPDRTLAVRAPWRDLDGATIRTVAVMCLSVMVIGMSYGVSGHGAGLSWWQLTIIAVVVLAGSSEFVFVAVLAAGGAPLLGAAAGLLVNTRNLGYGLAVGRHLDRGPSMLIGAHLINDETAALTAPETDRRRARAVFFVCGVGILACWPAGAALGALLGSMVADPDVLGLDAAFPALLAALAIPALREKSTATAALIGTGAALAAVPFVPPGVPVLIALVGVLLTVRMGNAHRSSDEKVEEEIG
nr:branched-chain amino acid permease [Gordonia sp. NB41Y]